MDSALSRSWSAYGVDPALSRFDAALGLLFTYLMRINLCGPGTSSIPDVS